MVIYEGPSLLKGGEPIVAVVTGVTKASENPKTGEMCQLWILPRDVNPVDAGRTGADASVCGDCPHRPVNMGSCYVVLHQGPRSVWQAYQRGKYEPEDAAHLGKSKAVKRRGIRLGAYGEPAALPPPLIESLTAHTEVVTGYTHAWSTCDPGLANHVMASCDSSGDRAAAKAKGWRTYRVLTPDEEPEENEVECPASESRPKRKRLTCQECGYCDGNRKDASGRSKKGDVYIRVHGQRANRFKRELTVIA